MTTDTVVMQPSLRRHCVILNPPASGLTSYLVLENSIRWVEKSKVEVRFIGLLIVPVHINID